MARVKNIVKTNFFRDSVQLLHLSEEVKKLKGVIDAALAMGTELNKELLEKEGLLTEEGRRASENDMIIAVKAEDSADIHGIIREIEELLTRPAESGETYYYSIESALKALPGANVALVSVPGKYAKDVVMEFINRGIHIHLFSDHVPLEDEIELKKAALEKGVLVMGPEAGTSIINGVALAFANVVDRGPIGIVAAAGTGLQETSVLITRGGSGITQGIGVGGRDVKSPVGGMMTLFSMRALEADENTEVITIVSKPPSPDVQEKIVNLIRDKGRKKYVTCFIGGQEFSIPVELKGRLVQTNTLHAASLESIRFVSNSLYEKALERISLPPEKVAKIVEDELSKLREGQRYVRGLFTGGTLLYESQVIFKEFLGDVWSNTPLNKDFTLPNAWISKEHSVIDLGEEEFTAGRAHPMIDPTIRLQRIVQEAKDPETAVIMLDFVLGYGSHPDPAEAHLSAIKKAKEIASDSGRHLTILAHVVGTERDPQNALEQENKLRKAGVILLPTNALMALVAGMIAKGDSSERTARNFFEKYLVGRR